jgi:uncharacterized membrane protein
MKKILISTCMIILMVISFSCTKSEDPNPTPTPTETTPGPKFLAAKSVITNSCALSGCHIAPSNSGGINFGSNASIVSNGSRIKATAVDQGIMPPSRSLSASEKSIITDWINAGGRLTD